MQFLGLISYSLYVFHATVGWRLIRLIGILAGDSPPLLLPYAAFIFSIAICVLTAWLGWRILENPSMRLSKRIDLPKVAN
jgi:peptidoglycan/LPS O-acetylase OafA/YrhL